MQNVIKNFNIIKREISNNKVNLIAVTKTFPIKHILPVINDGHEHFGENKVQEAIEKWTSIKEDFPKIKLHLIGKLQTNKAKFVLPLFDYIHSLDNIKLASKIADEQVKKKIKPKIFIQVNIGNEQQKSGVNIDNIENFYRICLEEFKLNIIGLMCIPPFDKNSEPYFKKMNELNQGFGLKELSMGMSSDYHNAINNGATFIRIGSKIFGERS